MCFLAPATTTTTPPSHCGNSLLKLKSASLVNFIFFDAEAGQDGLDLAYRDFSARVKVPGIGVAATELAMQGQPGDRLTGFPRSIH